MLSDPVAEAFGLIHRHPRVKIPAVHSSLCLRQHPRSPSVSREASLIKKEYCRCRPYPLQVISSRVRPPPVKGGGCIGPLSRNSWAGHSGSWPLVHCGDPKTLHWRLLLVPHCTLRLSHLSVGGNVRRLEIVGLLNM